MNRQIVGKKLVYDCSCEFDIDENDNLVFSADTHNPNHTIRWDCKETYRVLADFAQGVFQLESPLGKSFVRKLKPVNLEHIAALGSILRPGSLENKSEDGISTTEHYVRRKNGIEQVVNYHPIVDKILGPTYNLLIFQEQAMEIAKECAGFNLQEADILRKAIGHKLPEEMAKVKKLFLEKAKTHGVLSDEQAIEVFGWIEKSQRYSFNKCISGDAIINAVHGSRINTVRDLYNTISYRHYSNKKVPRDRLVRDFQKKGYLGWGLSLADDGTLVKNAIKNITYSGHLPVFRVTTADGFFIDLTKNHKVPTYNGIALVQDLVVGDKLHNKLLHKLDTALVEVVSIEPLGIVDTYDVEMSVPYHNFCANGIVVCNSHAVAYGITGYICAYIKTHFPLQFYTAWFKRENDRNMYKELANEAKVFASIGLYTPDLRDMEEEFYWKKNNIYFGMANIKGVRREDIDSLKNGDIQFYIWTNFLIKVLDNLNYCTSKALIRSGALDYYKEDRQKMLCDLANWRELNKDEQNIAVSNYEEGDNLIDLFKKVLDKKKFKGENRKNKLKEILKGMENPATPVIDTVDSIIYAEEDLLGLAITNHVTDNVVSVLQTHTCADILGRYNKYAVLKVRIDQAREYQARNGTMLFMKVSDNSGNLESVVAFVDVYEANKHLLTDGSLVFISGEFNRDRNSFQVQRVYSV